MRLSKIAFRNIFRNPKRSLLSVSAIAVASAAVLFLFSLLNGMLRETEENVRLWVTGTLSVQHRLYKENEHLSPMHYNVDVEQLSSRLKEIPGVEAVLPRLPFGAMIYDSLTTMSHASMGIGMEIAAEEKYTELSSRLQSGRLPVPGKRETVIGERLAAKLKKGLDDKITLFTQTAYRSANGATYRIVGIINFPIDGMNGSSYIIPLDRAQRLLKMNGKAKELFIHAAPETDDAALKRAVAEQLDTEKFYLKLWSEDEIMAMLATAQGTYDVMGLFFLALAGSVIMNSLMMVVFERTKEIGTIGALGMRSPEIVRLFLMEGFFMSIAAAISGIVLGLAFTVPFGIWGIEYGAEVEMGSMSFSVIYPRVSPRIVLNTFLFSVIVSTLISYIAVKRSAKIKPVEALRQ